MTSYTDHKISQAAFIIAKTDDSVGPFSVFAEQLSSARSSISNSTKSKILKKKGQKKA